jgi:hypothetical protein
MDDMPYVYITFSIYENFELVLNSFKFDFALKPNFEHALC